MQQQSDTRDTDTTRTDNEVIDIIDNMDLTDIKRVGNGEQEFQVRRYRDEERSYRAMTCHK